MRRVKCVAKVNPPPLTAAEEYQARLREKAERNRRLKPSCVKSVSGPYFTQPIHLHSLPDRFDAITVDKRQHPWKFLENSRNSPLDAA